MRLAIGDCGEGSGQWTIPVDPGLALGNDYTIRVTGSSNSLFTNVSGQFSITEDLTVIAPASGVIWPAGTQQTIAWTYLGNPGPSLKIDLYKAGVHSTTIANASSGKSGNGSYAWKLPGTLKPGADYQVKVYSTSAKYSSYSDMSSLFTVPQPLDHHLPGRWGIVGSRLATDYFMVICRKPRPRCKYISLQ